MKPVNIFLRVLLILIITVLVLFAAFFMVVQFTVYQPKPVEDQEISCKEDAPVIDPAKPLKIMSWNIQYLAGKDYVFFYDIKNSAGPDSKPSKEAIYKTLDEVIRIIENESPDILLIQEVNQNNIRTYHLDERELILSRLPEEYKCYSTAYYWKAAFIPHKEFLGAVGLEMMMVSKYKMTQAERYQLFQKPDVFYLYPFGFKRALQKVTFPLLESDKSLFVLNTHLDAFTEGTDTKERQIKEVMNILSKTNEQSNYWFLGGDLNSLPPGVSYDELHESRRYLYQNNISLKDLYELYQVFPTLEQVNGEERINYRTNNPNDPQVTEPGETIDYFIVSPSITVNDFIVRQKDTMDISDHFPLIMSIMFDE